MCEAKERRDVKKLKKAFGAALAELAEAPRTMRTAARVMETLIDARNGFRSIRSFSTIQLQNCDTAWR